MTEKRTRGRPIGSDINDQDFLREIADMLERNPRIKATSAMRQVMKVRDGQWVAASEDAMIRRLQVKWKAQKAVLQTQAKQRAEERERPATLNDLVDIGLRARDVWRAWQTPENLAGLQRFADRATAVMKEVHEAISHIRSVTIDADAFQGFAESSRQIEQFNHGAAPFELIQRRSDIFKLVADAQKQIEYAGKIRIPKI
jgi:hypothetical protein